VGGTSGIGEGMALTMAKMKADVTVAGRNKDAGDKIVAQMKALNPEGAYDFRTIDCSLMKDVQRFSQQYKEEFKQLNYLIISAGFMTTQGRTETKEGIDQKLAVHYYSRWFLIKELLPLLEATADAGQDARVMSVLAATKGGPAPEDDFGLKTHYSLRNADKTGPFHNDLMVEEFASRHPKIPFTHIFPGFVNTPLATRPHMPWYARWAAKAVSPFGTSILDCGQMMTYGLLRKETAKGWALLDSHGNIYPHPLKAQTEDMRKKVWKHTEELVDSALKVN